MQGAIQNTTTTNTIASYPAVCLDIHEHIILKTMTVSNKTIFRSENKMCVGVCIKIQFGL
jgi:hypothetical protein